MDSEEIVYGEFCSLMEIYDNINHKNVLGEWVMIMSDDPRIDKFIYYGLLTISSARPIIKDCVAGTLTQKGVTLYDDYQRFKKL